MSAHDNKLAADAMRTGSLVITALAALHFLKGGAADKLEILAMCPAVRGEEDHSAGNIQSVARRRRFMPKSRSLGDDLPACVHEGQMRRAGMIASFSRGRGTVFNGGSTEWPHALQQGDRFVDRIVRNVIDRFLASI